MTTNITLYLTALVPGALWTLCTITVDGTLVWNVKKAHISAQAYAHKRRVISSATIFVRVTGNWICLCDEGANETCPNE